MRTSSLNHAYKLIWSHVLNAWVAVSEITKGKGKSKSQKAAAILSSALFATAALAEPTGGIVTSGSGTISQTGTTTTINQSSQTLNLNWNTFNVGSKETVNFIQPSTTALAVNRILDTNGSRIMGNINANGQVWLINPNGVYFGSSATINVGSLLASTLNPLSNTTDATQVFGNGGTASVTNAGTINAADGGYVALIAKTVSNTGTITANTGTVALGAGSQVSVTFADNQLLSLTVDKSTLNNLAENKGLLQANGGVVLLSAGAKDSLLASVVNNEGVIEAKTVDHQAGKIILMGGMTAGTTKVAGTLDASAQTGDGGFIETSAATVDLTKAHTVTTLAAQGETGTWLIDPNDFTIAASGGNITGAQLSTDLASNNITISTATQGTAGGNGDIFVKSNVTWSSGRTLTLNAERNINVLATIDASQGSGGKVALFYGQGSTDGTINGTQASYNFGLTGSGFTGKINLQAGNNFSTKLGSSGTTIDYTVITSLGAQGSTTGTDLQGINGNLSGNYVLGDDIDASATNGWNNGEGFDPLGNSSTKFAGIFDGLGHTVTGLTINRSATNNVGLFGFTNHATLSNVGLVGGSVMGLQFVGGLVGAQNGGTISNAYATGSVNGRMFVGGLVGYQNGGSIINTYATGSVTGETNVGGLVGFQDGGSISNAYATGSVSGNSWVGGLVGYQNGGTISNAYATGSVSGTASVGGLVGDQTISTISNSFWNTQTSNQTTSAGGEGKTTAEMQQLSTFASWDIDAEGGTGSVWRIYEGQTSPLLRSFLTQLNVVAYDGSGTALTDIGEAALPAGTDTSKVLGTQTNNTLTLTSTQADSYNASIDATGLYSTQQGYDIISTRVITTTGSAAGDITLTNGVSWTNGTLNINGNVTNAGAISSTNGIFNLIGGTWSQLGALANFSVKDFRISGGTFMRFIDGDGTTTDPYQIADIYGLQGVGSAGMLDDNYTLENDIDASGTQFWNSDGAATPSYAGFNPLGNSTTKFTGTFDGLSHTITGLTINRGATNNVGLFGSTNNATLRNVGLVGGSVIGNERVGGLVGWLKGGSLTNAFTTGSVDGTGYVVGGLVGVLEGGNITNAYATGSVSGGDFVGGLVGSIEGGNITNTYATASVVSRLLSAGGLVSIYEGGTITNSYYSGTTTNIDGSVYYGNGLGELKTAAQLQQLSTFASWGIDAEGGTGSVWRIYEGQTAPLLRSFLTPLNLVAYDGSGTALTDIGKVVLPAGTDTNKILGSLTNPNANALTLTSTQAGSYNASIDATGLYSTQQGYDIISTRVITTTGSAAGDITLTNGVSWTNGTLNINGNVTNAGAISSSNGIFNLIGGTWSQLGTLANFSVKDFRISGGTFMRFIDGDGTSTDPYQIADIYGLQGVGSAGMLGLNYTLANDIDASGTSSWNGSAGFNPLGNASSSFTGTFDGLGHTVTGLTINRSSTSYAGLFGYTNNATLSNVGLVGGSMIGGSVVGGLVGYQNGGTISNAYATGSVIGSNNVGGLVGYQNGGTISNAYATGSVIGGNNVGGLVGWQNGSISNAYATGSVIGSFYVGGLVGFQGGGTISNAYATGSVSGNSWVGGLVGQMIASSISNAYATGAISATGDSIGGLVGQMSSSNISNVYATGLVSSSIVGNVGGLVGIKYGGTINNGYFSETTGQSANGLGERKTTAEMQQLSTFASWDIDAEGGTGSVWRIYEGQTSPLLRSFLTQLNVVAYDGSGTALTDIGEAALPAGTDTSKVLGTQTNNTLTLTSTQADSYNASIDATGLYSTQQGYDIISTRVITTTGSAAGDITLTNGVSWTNGTLNINGNVTNAGAIISTNGIFNLIGGTWSQLGALANFSVKDFRISGGTFMRFIDGDGTTTDPYQIADIYGLQGVGSAGMLDDNYTLANDIDASGTSNWNSGAGFNPLGNASSSFTGTFDGLGHIVTGLTINRPSQQYVGLFGYTQNANLKNVALENVSVTGLKDIGALVGSFNTSTSGSITDSHSSGNVTAYDSGSSANNIGGLVGSFVAGDNATANMASSSSSANVLASIFNSQVGGLIGYATSGRFGTMTVQSSSASGSVSGGSSYIGGLIGYVATTFAGGSTVSTSFATGDVEGRSSGVGGLVGLNNGIITTSYAIGDVTAGTPIGGGSAAGGLVGHNGNAGEIRNSYATGDVKSVNNYVSTGGLVGENTNVIDSSYATGSVTGVFNVGGLVGSSSRTISNAYATGTVTGNDKVGGLVGYLTGTASKVYATGSASGNSNVGGLVGGQFGGSVSNGYYAGALTNTSGATLADNSLGERKTSTEMKQLSTFTGWDIDAQGGTSSVWRIYEGYTNPLLRSFLTTANLGTTTVTYNGGTQDASSATTSLNSAHVLGNAASGRNASTYTTNYYSDQQGYDFVGGDLVITRKDITAVTGITAVNREYNGLLDATLSTGSADFTGKLSGDTLTVSTATGTFLTKDAADNKTVNITGITLDGSDAGNYNLTTTTASTTANITKKDITAVTGMTASNREYNGLLNASLNTGSADFTGKLSGDTLTVSTATGTFLTKDAADNKTVNITGITLGGSDAGNYTLTDNTASTTANITPATLTYVATPTSIIQGQTPSLTGAVTGFVSGEDYASVLGNQTALWTSPDAKLTTAGVYSVVGSGLTASNYNFAQAAGNASALTVKAGTSETITLFQQVHAGPPPPVSTTVQETNDNQAGNGLTVNGSTGNGRGNQNGKQNFNQHGNGQTDSDNNVNLNVVYPGVNLPPNMGF